MNILKIFLSAQFSLVRRLYYLVNNIYFNKFLTLKKLSKHNFEEKDFEEFYEKRLQYYKNEYSKTYKNFDQKVWLKDIILKTAITLPASKLSSNFNYGIILYNYLLNILQNLNDKNKVFNILEIGTARGFSALLMSDAINQTNTKAKILSIDVIDHNKDFFQNTYISNSKVSRKKIFETLDKKDELTKNIICLKGDTYSDLSKIIFNKIDFMFIDGEHNQKFLERELEYGDKYLDLNGVIVVDDYSESIFPEVVKTVQTFKEQNKYDLTLSKYCEDNHLAILSRK